MIRLRALQVVMVIVGLGFIAILYPVVAMVWGKDQPGYTDAMMGTIYAVLGVFLLLAVRRPAEHRLLIAFTAWSSVAHAALMAVMVMRDERVRDLLPGVWIFAAVGIPLLLLLPRKAKTTASV